MPAKCARGEVVYVDLDPARGSEPAKTRPCVVIQNDVGNRYSPVTIVAAITGAENVSRAYPIDVQVSKGEGGLEKNSVVQCNLIRCIDKSRIVRSIGRLGRETLRKIDRALAVSLGIDSP